MAKKNVIGMCAHRENEDCGGKNDDAGKPGQCRFCIVLEISWSLKLFQNEKFFCFFPVCGCHVCACVWCTLRPEVPTSSLLIAFHFVPEAGSLV